MPFLTTDDNYEIYYEKHGLEGPIIIFVSGYMGIADIWRPLLARLSNRYQCVVYDNRGYGRSSKPENPSAYTIERHALDLKSIMTTLHFVEPVLLVTHSMGGNIASAFYLSNTNITLARGIVQTGTHYDGKELRETGYTLERFAGIAHIPSEAMKLYVQLGLSEDIAIEAAKWPSYVRKNNALAMLDYELGSRIRDMRVPILLISGEECVSGGSNEAQGLADNLPMCKLHILAGVKNFPPTQAPDEVARLVDEFSNALS